MSFLTILEQEELNNRMKPKSWKKERDKAVKSVPFVVDINPEKSRRKDQKQWEMYSSLDENWSGHR